MVELEAWSTDGPNGQVTERMRVALETSCEFTPGGAGGLAPAVERFSGSLNEAIVRRGFEQKLSGEAV